MKKKLKDLLLDLVPVIWKRATTETPPAARAPQPNHFLSIEMRKELHSTMEAANKAMHRVAAAHLAAAQAMEGKHLNSAAKAYEKRISSLEGENRQLIGEVKKLREMLGGDASDLDWGAQ